MLLISEGQGGLHASQTGANNQDPAIQRDSLAADALGEPKAPDGRNNQARGLLGGPASVGMDPGTMLADIDSTDEVRINVVGGKGLVEDSPIISWRAGGNERAADSLVLKSSE